MKNLPFFGRHLEMNKLRHLKEKQFPSLVVVRGRRRIGKSRLLMEFGKEMKSLFFTGIPPTRQTSAQSQKDEFALQMHRELNTPLPRSDNWGDLFWSLAQQTKEGEVLIVLDEISWMGGKDPLFLGQLKTAWDMHFSHNPKLILVLCGSISSWIEKNILNSTGFFGRISLDLVLEELPLSYCNAFWGRNTYRIAPYEKLKLLAITGGIPFYLEQIQPKLSAEENIQRLCFSPNGLFVREFDEIFSDLFSRTRASHKKIVSILAQGACDFKTICSKLNKTTAGTYSKQLDELIKAGFVRREYTWDFSTGKISKLSKYRLSDNYLRFYLKYIHPNRAKIERGIFDSVAGVPLPNWEGIMGLQFENLVTNNFQQIWKTLQIRPERIVAEGPFFQTSKRNQSGCQIDYLIQTQFNTIYLCEIKFSRKPVGSEVISQVENKMGSLKIPKGFSIRPVLIHVNGIDESVEESQFFDKIIDFGEFLSTHN